MNELFALKYDELLTEFNRYVMTHPEFIAGIPDEALIVLVDANDAEFSRHNWSGRELMGAGTTNLTALSYMWTLAN